MPAVTEIRLQRHCGPRKRRGIATIWIILSVPAIWVLLCVLVDVANLWLARVELKNGLEAAALAAVKEWGEANGAATTEIPRLRGIEFAYSNTIVGKPLVLSPNRDPGDSPNENLYCAGNLVFGATINPTAPYIFDADVQPSCGLGDVTFDVSSSSSLQDPSSWGITFNNPPGTPSNLTILEVEFDLQAGSDADATFDFDVDPPQLSSVPGDVVGFTNPAAQIAFIPTSGNPSTFRITFGPDGALDDGFQPGDKIRFGARVKDLSTGTGEKDGDGIGMVGVEVRVIFALSGVPQPVVTQTFEDTMLGFPPNNDDQSIASLSGGGSMNAYAVHAQATVSVESIWGTLFGVSPGPFNISAQTTARYDCGSGKPELVRISEFRCSP